MKSHFFYRSAYFCIGPVDHHRRDRLVALQKLPVAQFPQITPPVVQIDADYPGASAEVVADSVARPIEVQLPGIDNLLYYDSTSTNDGHMTHEADVRDRH